ncbi:MAG: hypothetical protein KC445_08355 [Anaerolineales bacterium]|nr:hypothetical protein [Anaerolineales bacterium]
MHKPHKRNMRFLLVCIAGIMALTLTAGLTLRLDITAITILLIFQGLIFAAIWLWHHANRHTTGQEWWQDNEASGWRGY